jgi:hypothetical protein
VTVFEVDRGDFPDLDAGDVDRLSLARGDRLGAREFGADLFEFFADERDPGRQGRFLPSSITIPTTARRRIAIVSLRRPRTWRVSQAR